MAKHKRRIKLIKPLFQLKTIVTFLCIAVACVVVQFTLLNVAMTQMAMSLPQSIALTNSVYEILWHHLFLTLGLMVPLTVFVGILVTFRVAGPIFRFEQYFKALADGEDPGRCGIRDGDEFGELCDLINVGVDRLRSDAQKSTQEDSEPVSQES